MMSLSNSRFWSDFMNEIEIPAAPVGSFKHVPLACDWDSNVQLNLVVEVRNSETASYWLARIIGVKGYYVRLRFCGLGDDNRAEFIENLAQSDRIHHVGWAQKNGLRMLRPPALENMSAEEIERAVCEELREAHTLPANFHELVEQEYTSFFTKGMKLEAVDVNRISTLRPAIVEEVVDRRLRIIYGETLPELEGTGAKGYWFHEYSGMMRPVGWAVLHGQQLYSTLEYAQASLRKILGQENYEEDEANLDYFKPIFVSSFVKTQLEQGGRFRISQKLELIDPLEPGVVSVGTIVRILQNSWLVIKIDGHSAEDGSDLVCFHATSPSILYCGFAEDNGLQKHFKTPPHYKKTFSWETYCKETECEPAPRELFVRDFPSHGFEIGQFLEAADGSGSGNIYVARIVLIAGHLLRIHFEGYGKAEDQFFTMDSPDIYPIGYSRTTFVVPFADERPKKVLRRHRN